MALPAGVDTVTVSTGGVPLTLPDGTLMRGALTFTAPDLATIANEDFAFGGSIPVELEDGEFSVELVATDADGVSPTGWTYQVDARLTNAPDWTRYLELPADTPSVVLADVLITDAVEGTHDTLVVEKTRTTYKAGDQEVVSSTDLVDDEDLVLPVEANSVYGFDLFLDVEGDGNGDLKVTFTGPSGATGSWTPDGISLGNGNNIGSIKRSRNALGASDSVGVLPEGTVVTPRGQITTGSTAGDLTLRFAQDTSNATATVLKAGSWMRIVKLA